MASEQCDVFFMEQQRLASLGRVVIVLFSKEQTELPISVKYGASSLFSRERAAHVSCIGWESRLSGSEAQATASSARLIQKGTRRKCRCCVLASCTWT
jgi:hypothetical protein